VLSSSQTDISIKKCASTKINRATMHRNQNRQHDPDIKGMKRVMRRSQMRFKKFPKKRQIYDAGGWYSDEAIDKWRVDTAEKLQKLDKGGEAFLKELGDKICSECPFYMVTKKLLESLKHE